MKLDGETLAGLNAPDPDPTDRERRDEELPQGVDTELDRSPVSEEDGQPVDPVNSVDLGESATGTVSAEDEPYDTETKSDRFV